jgi:hypothetical protein
MWECRCWSTILDLGTRRWVVRFMSWLLYLRGKKRRNPLDRRLGGPQSRSGRCVLEKIFCLCRESNPSRPACSLCEHVCSHLIPELVSESNECLISDCCSVCPISLQPICEPYTRILAPFNILLYIYMTADLWKIGNVIKFPIVIRKLLRLYGRY